MARRRERPLLRSTLRRQPADDTRSGCALVVTAFGARSTSAERWSTSTWRRFRVLSQSCCRSTEDVTVTTKIDGNNARRALRRAQDRALSDGVHLAFTDGPAPNGGGDVLGCDGRGRPRAPIAAGRWIWTAVDADQHLDLRRGKAPLPVKTVKVTSSKLIRVRQS